MTTRTYVKTAVGVLVALLAYLSAALPSSPGYDGFSDRFICQEDEAQFVTPLGYSCVPVDDVTFPDAYNDTTSIIANQ